MASWIFRYICGLKSLTSSGVKPPWWIIFICLMTVLFPDSPAPLMSIFMWRLGLVLFDRLETGESTRDLEAENNPPVNHEVIELRFSRGWEREGWGLSLGRWRASTNSKVCGSNTELALENLLGCGPVTCESPVGVRPWTVEWLSSSLKALGDSDNRGRGTSAPTTSYVCWVLQQFPILW